MSRLRHLSLSALTLFAAAVFCAANPPAEVPPVPKQIQVQLAISQANTHLRNSQSQKAVAVLEEQLANVNGNTDYLTLLRDAYRAYIKDLYLAGQPEQAKRYIARLNILDPVAAEQFKQAPTRQPDPEPVPPAKEKSLFPRFNPFAKKQEPKTAAPIKPATVRLQAEDPVPDPFDPKQQRAVMPERNKAQDLLARGADEFSRKRYPEARVCFEQAYQADQKSLGVCRDQWAYCLLKGVSDQMEQPALAGNWTELQQQVKNAMQMAPKLAGTGQQLLNQLEQQSKAAPAGAPPKLLTSAVRLRHLGRNPEGWQVTETEHFRIFHQQDEAFGERAGRLAEQTRTAMYRKWFDSDGVDWQPICEMILHPTAQSYTQMTGVPANSPGHSRIESDPSGRVVARRIDLRQDAAGMMEAVLPHETTHVVLAGMFGVRAVPRWVDEGIAVLTEPDEKIDMHRRNLLKQHQDGSLFGLRELMELTDYPAARRIGAFYAQSVVLVEFLSKQRGPKVFTDFVKDGLRGGYETALQRHYQLTFAQLEQQWADKVLKNGGRVAATK